MSHLFSIFELLLIYINLTMKRLIISVLMLMIATFLFSQGNKSNNEDKGINPKLVKTEQSASTKSNM